MFRRVVPPALLLLAGTGSLLYGLMFHRLPVLVEEKTVTIRIPIPSPFGAFAPGELPLPGETPAVEEEEPAARNDSGIRPDKLRRREELELFSLDTLRMVGTLERDERWALVKNKQGVIYRVKPGNYMGKNHGRITAIYDDRIELVEIVPDRAGGYIERPAQLAIGE